MIIKTLHFFQTFLFKVNFQILNKYSGSNFNILVQPVTVDLCQFLNGTNSNVVIKWFAGIFASSLPNGFVHPCPYKGAIEAYNVTVKPFSETKFHGGQYLGVSRWYDDQDENILTTNHLVEAIAGRGKKGSKNKMG